MAIVHVTGVPQGDAGEIKMLDGATGGERTLVDAMDLGGVRLSTAVVVNSDDPVAATLNIMGASLADGDDAALADMTAVATSWATFKKAVDKVAADEKLSAAGRKDAVAKLVDAAATEAGRRARDVERARELASVAEREAAWPKAAEPSPRELADAELVRAAMAKMDAAFIGGRFVAAASKPEGARNAQERQILLAAKRAADLGFPCIAEPHWSIGVAALVRASGAAARVASERRLASLREGLNGTFSAAVKKTVARYALEAEWHAAYAKGRA